MPLPGPVLGLLLMFLLLLARPRLVATVAPVGDVLLKYLGLLFVPVSAGVMLYFDLLRAEWLPILVALFVSTLLGMVATALTLDRLLKRIEARHKPETESGHE
jgi:holin-like protein